MTLIIMSNYIPQYQHDIFVSYVHIDNQALVGAKDGWVTTFTNTLKTKLCQKLGRTDAFSLWMDRELRGNTPATPETLKHIQESAILLLVLSHAYIESEWCALERNTFFSNLDENSGRVFIIEYDEIKDRPHELGDLLGYKFWRRDERTGMSRTLAVPQPHPEEREYYEGLDDLSHQLADKLKSLKEEAKLMPSNNKKPSNIGESQVVSKPPISSIPSNAPSKTTVFLAEVTSDLEEQRNEVKRFLIQQNIKVLPEKQYSFSTLEEELNQDLTKCSLFIQLLSNKVDNFFNYPLVQYERAQTKSLAILQWCNPIIAQKETITDNILLTNNSVIATELVNFQEIILTRLQPKKRTITPPNEKNDWVFVNTSFEDKVYAKQITDVLQAKGISYSLPMEVSSDTLPSEVREDQEQNLEECDAVILPFHNTSAAKIRQSIIQCHRISPKRKKPLKIFAICDKSLPNKQSLNMNLCDLQILECPSLEVDSCLPQFINSLEKNNTSPNSRQI